MRLPRPGRLEGRETPTSVGPTDLTPSATTSDPPVPLAEPKDTCLPVDLEYDGFIVIAPSRTLLIDRPAQYLPPCSTAALGILNHTNTLAGYQAPFYASATPQIYATAAATFISWMLVALLIITPRTFFVGSTIHYTSLRGRGGLIGGSTGGASVIGVGSRPWLQKIAAVTVAISMTVATADTFKFARKQYDHGHIDGLAMHTAVVDTIEMKVTRVVSDIFIWLAQVQTLIRLFPRHREKVLIKWIGFCFIVIDSTFTCLNTFLGNPLGRPQHFADAIPTINYLFQLALSMMYAGLVIYYAWTKRRYAFYHPIMWNISVISVFSIIAILTPIAFFITDITNASVAIWGDYFRWAGAAASSVIVWEWVERIEALERDEKKDGILGREVFDSDEMLVVPDARHPGAGSGSGSNPADTLDRRHRRFFGLKFRSPRRDSSPSSSINTDSSTRPGLLRVYHRRRNRRRHPAIGTSLTVTPLSEHHLRNLHSTTVNLDSRSGRTSFMPQPGVGSGSGGSNMFSNVDGSQSGIGTDTSSAAPPPAAAAATTTTTTTTAPSIISPTESRRSSTGYALRMRTADQVTEPSNRSRPGSRSPSLSSDNTVTPPRPTRDPGSSAHPPDNMSTPSV